MLKPSAVGYAVGGLRSADQRSKNGVVARRPQLAFLAAVVAVAVAL